MALSKPQVKNEDQVAKEAEAAKAKAAAAEAEAAKAKETAAQAAEDEPEQALAKEDDVIESTAERVNDEPEAAAEAGAQAEEPEAQAEAPIEQRKEVATATGTTAVSVTEDRQNMAQRFKEDLAAEGFEDIELTGRSFDRVILHEGTFKIGDGVDIGKEFNFIPHTSRAVFVVRQSDAQDAEVYYSYDPKGEFLADGSPATEVLEKWREDGYATEDSPVDIKKYMELMITIVDRDDEYNDHMASLSIPPASRDRVAGVFAMAKQKFKSSPSGVVISAKVGKEVGEGKKKFRPWNFGVVRLVG